MMRNPQSPAQVVGARIRQIRDALGITQRELARRIGIDQSRLSRLERGETLGAVDLLVTVAATLEVSPAYLLAPGDDATMQVGTLELSAETAREWMRGGLLPDADPRATYAALTKEERLGIARAHLTRGVSPLAQAAAGPDWNADIAQRADDLAWEATEGEKQRRKRRTKGGDDD